MRAQGTTEKHNGSKLTIIIASQQIDLHTSHKRHKEYILTYTGKPSTQIPQPNSLTARRLPTHLCGHETLHAVLVRNQPIKDSWHLLEVPAESIAGIHPRVVFRMNAQAVKHVGVGSVVGVLQQGCKLRAGRGSVGWALGIILQEGRRDSVFKVLVPNAAACLYEHK